MEVTHLIQESPAQPGATTRSGNPCFTGSVSPFISYARRVLGSRALLKGTRTLEVGHGAEGNIGAIEQDFAGRGFQAGALEHVGEADPAPARIAHGPVAPLQAGHRRLVESAAVPGALENADELGGGQLFQIVHGERERRRDRASDAQTPFVDIHGGNVDVRAHEKMLDGSEVVGEAGERHLQILGADGAGEHVALGTIFSSQKRARRGGGEAEEVAARNAHAAIVRPTRRISVEVFQAGAGVVEDDAVGGLQEPIRDELAGGGDAGRAFGGREDSFERREFAAGIENFLRR